MRRFFDWLQLHLHLAGLHGLAMAVGHLGSPPQLPEPNVHERITLTEPLTVDDLVPEVRSGVGWNLDESPDAGPLKVVDFDPTFNNNAPDFDAAELALPHTKMDIN